MLLAHDARYDGAGRPDWAATNSYVPNDYLFGVVREHPDLFVPCVSINPRRRDALDELDRCADLGGRVVKVHPPTQDVDPADTRFREDYFQHLRALAARFPNLYCDTAVLASMFRWRNIPQLVADSSLADRILYASDWPFTSNALVFWNRIAPGQVLSLCAERNLFERDSQLKRLLGLPEAAFSRGARLLGLA